MARARVARRLRDEEVVAAAVRVVLETGVVVGQELLRDLVLELVGDRGGAPAGLTPERARRLAARSGLVEIDVRVRDGGTTPDLDGCLVCASALERTANRTLTGGRVPTGYRCRRCGWWTGARELRVPARYVFAAKLERKGGQTRFRRSERQRTL
ncbi:MAG TPA: hypothetical protein VI997_10840 [Candidatus Thermoplasmatota archaeon]|nr:hypothetical protein [Candidatus Thermoplasmatota archaeon]